MNKTAYKENVVKISGKKKRWFRNSMFQMVKADILILCMSSFKSFKILVSFWVQVLERQERPGLELLPDLFDIFVLQAS